MSQTLESGLQILDALAAFRTGSRQSEVPLRDIAAATALNKSTTYRLLQSLAKFGFVATNGKGAYYLGPASFALARAAADWSGFVNNAIPIMREISQKTKETVSLCERNGLVSITVYEIESSQPVRYANKLGSTVPLYVSASARAILAFSDTTTQSKVLTGPLLPLTDKTHTDPDILRKLLLDIRKNGFATSMGERVSGTNSVAAPILGADGYARGAIGILWPSRGTDLDGKRLNLWPDMLVQAVTSLHGAQFHDHA